MKKYIVCFMAAVMLGFSACSFVPIEAAKNIAFYTIDLVDINSSITTLKIETETAEKMVAANWSKFADEDKANLIVIQQNIRNIFAHLEMLRSTNFYKITVADIEYFYEIGKYSHTLGKEIYIKYEGDIPVGEQIWWELYNEDLKEVAAKIDALDDTTTKAVVTEVLKSSLNIASIGLKIVVPMFGDK